MSDGRWSIIAKALSVLTWAVAGGFVGAVLLGLVWMIVRWVG